MWEYISMVAILYMIVQFFCINICLLPYRLWAPWGQETCLFGCLYSLQPQSLECLPKQTFQLVPVVLVQTSLSILWFATRCQAKTLWYVIFLFFIFIFEKEVVLQVKMTFFEPEEDPFEVRLSHILLQKISLKMSSAPSLTVWGTICLTCNQRDKGEILIGYCTI